MHNSVTNALSYLLRGAGLSKISARWKRCAKASYQASTLASREVALRLAENNSCTAEHIWRRRERRKKKKDERNGEGGKRRNNINMVSTAAATRHHVDARVIFAQQ
jgi:hypothetical protein